MASDLRLIHLSDPHIGYRQCAKRFRSVVSNIVAREKAEGTIIIITGDLVEDIFHNDNLEDALEVVGILKKAGFKVLICPGNHDCGNGWVNTRGAAEKFMQAFDLSFPRVDIIEDTAFIGLDSNVEELHWYDRFFADGEIGKEQLQKLDEIINRPEFQDKTKVVYLHHHPIDMIPFHKLKDHKEFGSIIRNKVDVVLYGHNHAGKNHSGTWGIKIMLDGGSSTGKRMLWRKAKHRMISLSDFSICENNYLKVFPA
jgi:3',5'-cyclic AMP phosphodiesterase CpdA